MSLQPFLQVRLVFLMWLFKIINYSKLQKVASFNFKHLFHEACGQKKIEITSIELVGRKNPSVFVKLFWILVMEICLIVRECFFRIHFELVKKSWKTFRNYCFQKSFKSFKKFNRMLAVKHPDFLSKNATTNKYFIFSNLNRIL
jgi:hypothetical protein